MNVSFIDIVKIDSKDSIYARQWFEVALACERKTDTGIFSLYNRRNMLFLPSLCLCPHLVFSLLFLLKSEEKCQCFSFTYRISCNMLGLNLLYLWFL